MGSATDAFTRNPQVAEAMVERIIGLQPKSGAEALKELRAAFPDSPLALRVAALAALSRRQDQHAKQVPA
jgi:hypothetical protein